MIEEQKKEILHKNLKRVEERIEAACRKAGRDRKEVTLVAVTKYAPSEVAALLPDLDIIHLGESRPQSLWQKAAEIDIPVQWHLIGHLQTNKAEKTVPLVHLIHSADRLRLLDCLEKIGESSSRAIAVLLEVNASREENKHGFAPEALPALVPRLNAYRNVHIQGLMTMAAWEEDPENCRPTFRLLRELKGQLESQFEPPHSLHHLSMGMSNDYPIAIEEGATWIRVGSALFEGLL